MVKAAAATRVTLEPAFVLHRYDWSESSVIVEVLTQHYGRVALVAKGAKRPASNFRPILLPMQPLRLTFTGDDQIRTLKSAEWVGGFAMPSGQALLSGFYLNELMMRILPRDEPQAPIYQLYAQTVQFVAEANPLQAPALRAFELLLLQHMGWLPDLSVETQTQRALQADAAYQLSIDGGLQCSSEGEASTILGSQWQKLATLDFSGLIQLLATEPLLAQALKKQVRRLLNYHAGRPLQTPLMLAALQQISIKT
jgi:DNA repair protein RecO (recombination protein O)